MFAQFPGGGGGVGQGRNNLNNNNIQGVFSWYLDIPIVSRLYLTAAVLITSAVFLDFISPLTLYYNFDLILHKGHYWRLITSFLFFGQFSLDFLFHLYFVVRYCRLLEEGQFRGRTADFIYMIMIGAVLMLVLVAIIRPFEKIKFLGHSLAFMMVYLWARSPEQRHVRMSLMGIFPFNAPYLPWVLLMFSLFIQNPIETDFLGIIVGHVYYFFDQIYPKVATLRGWSLKTVIATPSILRYLCNSDNDIQYIEANEIHHEHND